MNYNNGDESPLKKGKMSDVIKPKRHLFKRITSFDKKDAISEMSLDLVRILTDVGIVLQNTRTISRLLIECGWVKTKKIEKDT